MVPDVPLPPGCPPTADRRGWLSAYLTNLDEALDAFLAQLRLYPGKTAPRWLVAACWRVLDLKLTAYEKLFSHDPKPSTQEAVLCN